MGKWVVCHFFLKLYERIGKRKVESVFNLAFDAALCIHCAVGLQIESEFALQSSVRGAGCVIYVEIWDMWRNSIDLEGRIRYQTGAVGHMDSELTNGI